MFGMALYNIPPNHDLFSKVLEIFHQLVDIKKIHLSVIPFLSHGSTFPLAQIKGFIATNVYFIAAKQGQVLVKDALDQHKTSGVGYIHNGVSHAVIPVSYT